MHASLHLFVAEGHAKLVSNENYVYYSVGCSDILKAQVFGYTQARLSLRARYI